MKIYVSARYPRREDAEELARMLVQDGHFITSRWVWRDQPSDYEECTHTEIGEFAMEDIADVIDAEIFVAISEESDSPFGRGGRHVEFGFALARGIALAVIGPMENIFHYMSHVKHYESNDEFVKAVSEMPK